ASMTTVLSLAIMVPSVVTRRGDPSPGVRQDMPMEVFDDRVCALGEGPVYDDRTGRAYWVDVPGHRVLWRDLADGTRGEFATAADVSAAVPREKGGFVLLLPTGPTLVDPTGVVETTIAYDGEGFGARACREPIGSST